MSEKKLNTVIVLLVTLGLISYFLAGTLFFSQKGFANQIEIAEATQVSLLETVQNRGYIKCGVATNRPGYSSMLSREPVANELLNAADHDKELYDNSAGIEADMCRAAALGLFGELEGRVYFKNLDGNWTERMIAVENNDVDILFRGTGLTPELGITHNVSILPVIYLEPIMILAKKDYADSAESVPDGANICAIENTFSYFAAKQFTDFMGSQWVFPKSQKPEKTYKGYSKMVEDYKQNNCQVLLGRYSSIRNVYINHKLSEEHNRIVLGDAYHVPIAGVVPGGEREWHNFVSQSIWSTLKAQYQGYTSDAVPEVFNAKAWSLMGLDEQNPSKMIRSIGSYVEIYQRNLGDDLPEAGPNNHFLANPAGRLLVPL